MFDVGPDFSTMLIIFGGIVLMLTIIVYFASKRNLGLAGIIFSISSNYFISLFYEWPSLYSNEIIISFFVNRIWPIINIILFMFIVVRYFKKIKSKNNG